MFAITSRTTKAKLPTHIDIFGSNVGLSKDSVVLLEQIRTLDKTRLKERMGHLDDVRMKEVNEAISVSFGLSTYQPQGGANTYFSVSEAPMVAKTDGGPIS